MLCNRNGANSSVSRRKMMNALTREIETIKKMMTDCSGKCWGIYFFGGCRNSYRAARVADQVGNDEALLSDSCYLFL